MTTTAERFGDDFGAERMWGLKELAYPEPVSYLPQTAGWLVLAIIILALLGWFAWRARERWKQNAYRREGIKALDHIAADPAAISQLPFLVRKAALLAYPRNQVAMLHGESWRKWLNSVAGQELFSSDDVHLLDELAYAPPDALRIDDRQRLRIVKAGKRWMQVHRV